MKHEGFVPTQLDAKRPNRAASTPLADTFVVLLESDANARDFLTALLGLHGAVVVSTASEREALDLLGTGMADVLVGGVGESNAGRLALIRRVRTMTPEDGGTVPAVTLTDNWNVTSRADALAAGYQECLAWPFAAIDLVETARRLAQHSTGSGSDRLDPER